MTEKTRIINCFGILLEVDNDTNAIIGRAKPDDERILLVNGGASEVQSKSFGGYGFVEDFETSALCKILTLGAPPAKSDC